LMGASGPVGTVVLYDVPNLAPGVSEAAAMIAELVSSAIEATRLRAELERQRQQAVDLRATHERELDHHRRRLRKLNQLKDEVLLARRSGIDTLEVTVKKGDIARVLGECAKEMAVSAAEKSIDLSSALAALPPVAFDEGKLRQVLVNLLANAIKFTPAGGRV